MQPQPLPEKPTVRAAVKERPAPSILDDIVIAPEIVEEVVEEVVETPVVSKFAAAAPSKFAAFTPNKFAAATTRTGPSRFAAAETSTGSRFVSTTRRRGRFGPSRFTAGLPVHQLNRQIVTVPPPPRRSTPTPPGLIWVSVKEYEESFEGGSFGLWVPGHVAEFDRAAESLRRQEWDEGGYQRAFRIAMGQQSDDDDEEEELEDDRDHHILGITVADVSHTYQFDTDDYNGDVIYEQGWDDVLLLSQQLRAQLADEPSDVLWAMDFRDARVLADMVGLNSVPTKDDVAEAITADPMSGLGGAALDRTIWHNLDVHQDGFIGNQLVQLLRQVCRSDDVNVNPVENFLLYTDSLHPNTPPLPHPYDKSRTQYRMHGAYVATNVKYHSDPNGDIFGGFRSVYLMPLIDLSELGPHDPSND